MIARLTPAFFGYQQHRHLAPFRLRILIHGRNFFHVFFHSLQQHRSQFHVGHFPPPEAYCYLATVTYFDELGQLSQFDPIILSLGTWAELDFLNLNLALFFALVVQLFLLLKPELTIIHQPANRWFRIGYQFDQVQFSCFGELLRFLQCYDAFLLTIFGDEPDFRCRNIIVQTALFIICDWIVSRLSLSKN